MCVALQSRRMKPFYSIWLYAVVLVALAAASVQSMVEERRLLAEAQVSASTIAVSIEDSVLANYHANRFDLIAKNLNRVRLKQRLLGIALCQNTGSVLSSTSGVANLCARVAHSKKSIYYSHFLDSSPDENSLSLVFERDGSYLKTRWIATFFRTFFLTLVGCAVVIILMASQLREWLKRYLRRIRQLSRNHIAHGATRGSPKKTEIPSWLQDLKAAMGRKQLVVIANREPYIHQKVGDEIQVIRPASGLVTALEPILRKCGGLWIAHGSGSADREVVNVRDMVAVPPGKPKYMLKRVWLTQEQEQGYYYGFANEGLWPLCHLAHTRPVFRLPDWNHYQDVNQQFANSVPEETFNGNSIILVQDYHFALLPRLLKQRAQELGKSTPQVGIFWHIPWPNPETFGICPWQKELLLGMLGADVIGFHTQYHCNNFLEACNRYLEARIDYEKFSVTVDNRETFVQPFPIGIDTAPVRVLSQDEIERLKIKYGIKAKFVAVGVDRIDYTKGIIERVEAVERFLEKNPDQIGNFSLVQMGSPSRTHIPAYRLLAETLDETVKRINAKFSTPDGYQPILFLNTHHDWEEIQYFYQIGDICMVTSLHDGMNLVAKEYIWCQRAERGSLILSKFTGASRELTEAFIVNPYAIEEMADAITKALALTPAERAARMNAMKVKVASQNAYQWASSLIRALVTKGETAAPPQAEQDLLDSLTSTKTASF